MAVYPFYVKTEPTGSRKTPIQGGCRNKDGEQKTIIYQRERGDIVELFTIDQWSFIDKDGKRILCCRIEDRHGNIVAEDSTEY